VEEIRHGARNSSIETTAGVGQIISESRGRRSCVRTVLTSPTACWRGGDHKAAQGGLSVPRHGRKVVSEDEGDGHLARKQMKKNIKASG